MNEIEILERALKQGGTFGFVPEFEKAGKTAIKALEKQVPKRVVREAAVWPDGQDRLKLFCPICHEYVSSDEKYCSDCGQKLDWSETNE